MEKRNQESIVPPKHVRRAEFYKRLSSEVDKENLKKDKEPIIRRNKGYKREMKFGWDREDD